MYSDNQSYSDLQDQDSIISVFGLYFCQTCKNVMTPMRANGKMLQFFCPKCGKKQINFSNRRNKDAMLYSKELQIGSKKYEPDLAYIFDPTMPSVEVTCPECFHNRAVYFLTPDQGQSKIIAKMICASQMNGIPKCGHIWDLQDYHLLEKYCIKQGNQSKKAHNPKFQQSDD